MPAWCCRRRPTTTAATAPTTTATEAPTTTTTMAPIVYDSIPPGGRQNLGGDKHPMTAHPAFGMIVIPKINLVHPIFEGIEEQRHPLGPGALAGVGPSRGRWATRSSPATG